MVGGGELSFYAEEGIQFLHERRSELGTSVENDFFRQPVKFPDMVSVKSGEAKGGIFVMSWDEVSALGESIIDDEDVIVAEAFREVSDEVGGNTFPGSIGNGDWDKFAWGRFGEGFGSGTEVASLHIVSNKPVHVRPPIVA